MADDDDDDLGDYYALMTKDDESTPALKPMSDGQNQRVPVATN